MNTAPKLYIETLREMFAVCANERRMKEADALAAAIAALAPPSGEAVAWQYRDEKWPQGEWTPVTREQYEHMRIPGNVTGPRDGWNIRQLYASPPATVDVGALRGFAERLRLMDERTLTAVRSARLMVTDKQYEVVTLEPAAWNILRDYIRQRGNLAVELAALIGEGS